jgi:hypothetical protein
MPFGLADKIAEFLLMSDGNNASWRCGWTGYSSYATFGFILAVI